MLRLWIHLLFSLRLRGFAVCALLASVLLSGQFLYGNVTYRSDSFVYSYSTDDGWGANPPQDRYSYTLSLADGESGTLSFGQLTFSISNGAYWSFSGTGTYGWTGTSSDFSGTWIIEDNVVRTTTNRSVNLTGPCSVTIYFSFTSGSFGRASLEIEIALPYTYPLTGSSGGDNPPAGDDDDDNPPAGDDDDDNPPAGDDDDDNPSGGGGGTTGNEGVSDIYRVIAKDYQHSSNINSVIDGEIVIHDTQVSTYNMLSENMSYLRDLSNYVTDNSFSATVAGNTTSSDVLGSISSNDLSGYTSTLSTKIGSNPYSQLGYNNLLASYQDNDSFASEVILTIPENLGGQLGNGFGFPSPTPSGDSIDVPWSSYAYHYAPLSKALFRFVLYLSLFIYIIRKFGWD